MPQASCFLILWAPLQKGYQCPPQLMGRYWQGGKVGNRYLKSPAVQSQKAGCLTMGSQRLGCCWVEPLPQHCQTKQRQWSFRAWGRGGDMQESGQLLPQGLSWYLEHVSNRGLYCSKQQYQGVNRSHAVHHRALSHITGSRKYLEFAGCANHHLLL